MNDPLAYFLTFHTYGTWLPGHERGSVDDEHNRLGEAFIPPDETKLERSREQMLGEPVCFNDSQRRIVLQAIVGVAEHRKWPLHAAHVRTTHVHIVVTSTLDPERTMNDFKAWATRKLREAGEFDADRVVWSRHGSTPYLWTEEQVVGAVRYTLHEQGIVLSGAVFPDVST
jgi:REP element-mobilizing transposase RayT